MTITKAKAAQNTLVKNNPLGIYSGFQFLRVREINLIHALDTCYKTDYGEFKLSNVFSDYDGNRNAMALAVVVLRKLGLLAPTMRARGLATIYRCDTTAVNIISKLLIKGDGFCNERMDQHVLVLAHKAMTHKNILTKKELTPVIIRVGASLRDKLKPSAKLFFTNFDPETGIITYKATPSLLKQVDIWLEITDIITATKINTRQHREKLKSK